MQIIGLIFTGSQQYGDFAWMIEQPDYADALFIFNDHEEQFLEHRKTPVQHGVAPRAVVMRSSGRINVSNHPVPPASPPVHTVTATLNSPIT